MTSEVIFGCYNTNITALPGATQSITITLIQVIPTTLSPEALHINVFFHSLLAFGFPSLHILLNQELTYIFRVV